MSKTPKLRFKEFSGDWEEKKLGEVCKINPKTKELPDKFYYIDLESVEKGKLLKDIILEKNEAPSRAQRLLSDKDILFQTVRPYQNNNYYFISNKNLQSVASTGYAQLRSFINSKFLYFLLHTERFGKNVLLRCTGSNYPAINTTDLSEIDLNVPSKEEQEKIASFLSLVDDKISLQSEKVNALKDYKNGMMQKIFNRELRFKDDEGRDYPEWEEKKLGDLIKIKSNRNKNNLVDLVLSVSNTKGFITQSEQFEDRVVASSDVSNYKIVEKNDFAFNPARINVGSIARLKLYDKGIISPMYICFKCLNSIKSEYLEYFLRTNLFNVQMKKKLEGSVRQTLSSEALCEIIIYLPCLKEQQKIANLLIEIDKKIEKEQEKLNILNQYKKGLLQQMFV